MYTRDPRKRGARPAEQRFRPAPEEADSLTLVPWRRLLVGRPPLAHARAEGAYSWANEDGGGSPVQGGYHFVHARNQMQPQKLRIGYAPECTLQQWADDLVPRGDPEHLAPLDRDHLRLPYLFFLSTSPSLLFVLIVCSLRRPLSPLNMHIRLHPLQVCLLEAQIGDDRYRQACMLQGFVFVRRGLAEMVCTALRQSKSRDVV